MRFLHKFSIMSNIHKILYNVPRLLYIAMGTSYVDRCAHLTVDGVLITNGCSLLAELDDDGLGILLPPA